MDISGEVADIHMRTDGEELGNYSNKKKKRKST